MNPIIQEINVCYYSPSLDVNKYSVFYSPLMPVAFVSNINLSE